MKVSTLIEKLQAILAEHGDIDMTTGYQDDPAGYAGVQSVIVEERGWGLATVRLAEVVPDSEHILAV